MVPLLLADVDISMATNTTAELMAGSRWVYMKDDFPLHAIRYKTPLFPHPSTSSSQPTAISHIYPKRKKKCSSKPSPPFSSSSSTPPSPPPLPLHRSTSTSSSTLTSSTSTLASTSTSSTSASASALRESLTEVYIHALPPSLHRELTHKTVLCAALYKFAVASCVAETEFDGICASIAGDKVLVECRRAIIELIDSNE